MFSETTRTSSGASLCAVVSSHDASPLTQAAVAQQAAWPPRIYTPTPRASDAGSNNSANSYTCSSSVYSASQYGCVSPSSTGSPGPAFMHTAPGSFTFRSASGCSASSYAACPSPPWAGSTCSPAGPYTGMDHGLGPAHVPMHAAQTECGGALVLYGANHVMVGGRSLLGLYYDERVHGPNAAKDAVNPFAPGEAACRVGRVTYSWTCVCQPPARQ